MQKILIVVFCLAIGISAPAYNAFGETQATMTEDACRELENSNFEMKKLYTNILQAHSTDKRFLSAFRKAQNAWTAFRDAHLNAVYPQGPKAYVSSHGMCRCILLNELTRERVTTLRKWLSESTEGDVCAGSMGRTNQ